MENTTVNQVKRGRPKTSNPRNRSLKINITQEVYAKLVNQADGAIAVSTLAAYLIAYGVGAGVAKGHDIDLIAMATSNGN
jgi:hypothetical protein